MKLGLSLGYSGANLRLPVDRVQLAERLGYDSVWTAEAYGSDAITPLAYLAALTTRIRLGTGMMQLAARTPAMAAMALGTLDALAGGGRVIGGLGVSGPQIVEGWYGQPWGRPVLAPARLRRDHAQDLRARGAGESRGRGDLAALHRPRRGRAGQAAEVDPAHEPAIPIWLGTGTEANVMLTAEVADGWLPFGFAPARMRRLRPWLEEGFRRAGGGKSLRDFEIQAGVAVIITDDVRAGLAARKPRVALYVGGMGHREELPQGEDASAATARPRTRIQELFLAQPQDEAIAAVPDEYVDEGGLVGPVARIRERYRAWEDCGITGLTIATQQDEAHRADGRRRGDAPGLEVLAPPARAAPRPRPRVASRARPHPRRVREGGAGGLPGPRCWQAAIRGIRAPR